MVEEVPNADDNDAETDEEKVKQEEDSNVELSQDEEVVDEGDEGDEGEEKKKASLVDGTNDARSGGEMEEDDPENEGITKEQLAPFLQASGTRVGLSFLLPKNLIKGKALRSEPGLCTIVDSQPPLGRAASLKMKKQNGWMIVKDFGLRKETKKTVAYRTWAKSAQCAIQNDCIYRVDTDLKKESDKVLLPAPAPLLSTSSHAHVNTHTHAHKHSVHTQQMAGEDGFLLRKLQSASARYVPIQCPHDAHIMNDACPYSAHNMQPTYTPIILGAYSPFPKATPISYTGSGTSSWSLLKPPRTRLRKLRKSARLMMTTTKRR